MNANTAPDLRWSADSDYKDPSAPRGYGRDILARKVSRVDAEAALATAILDHVSKTGHEVPSIITWPGKTWTSCLTCKRSFDATGRA